MFKVFIISHLSILSSDPEKMSLRNVTQQCVVMQKAIWKSRAKNTLNHDALFSFRPLAHKKDQDKCGKHQNSNKWFKH